MSCRVFNDIDMTRYLLDPGAQEFAAFREHYPACPDCARELGTWTALEQVLAQPSEEMGAVQPSWHPDPEALARFAGSPGATGSEVETMQRHIDDCPTCRTEWRALARFDFAEAVGVPWQATRASRDKTRAAGWFGRAAAWLGFDTPARAALAIALVVAAALAMTWWANGASERTAHDGARVVERSQAPAPRAAEPARSEEALPSSAAGELAAAPIVTQTHTAAVVSPAMPVPSPALEVPAQTPAASPSSGSTGDLVQLAQADGGTSGPRAVSAVDRDDDRRRQATNSGDSFAVGDEVLLASISKMPPPDYTAPAGASQLAWMHEFGSVRSASRGPGAADVFAHAPDHVGLTREASPRLWWSISAAAPQPIVITLTDDRAIDPLLEAVIEGPQAAGMGSISLADHGVVLEPGVEYRWFVTLVLDADRPSRNPISAGSIKRVALDPAGTHAFAAGDPAALGHELAQAGLWYDSYDFFAGLSSRHPDATIVGSYRDILLAEAGTVAR